jgi:hypothetical protein
MNNREKKYWIIVASKDHVKNGIEEGIAQSCHGKVSSLKRMRKDDFVVFYSSKYFLDKNDKCQEFTAIGRVKDDDIYHFQMTPDFCPARRNIDFLKSIDTSIIPIINSLEFIKDKKSWGYPFRFGILEINQHDFELIASLMLLEKNEKEY